MSKFFFGNPKNVKVGQVFNSRIELAKAGIHKPLMAGIWGREKEGACSVVLSGGYEDDIDNADNILYTGQGGQDVPGGKQIKDQEFIRGNRALQISCDSFLPVRVTRGFQIKNGPSQGYRYDGIYFVKSYKRSKGKSGFYVCRFHLVREKVFTNQKRFAKKKFFDSKEMLEDSGEKRKKNFLRFYFPRISNFLNL